MPTTDSPDARARACIQPASAVPMPRPRWSGCTAASPRAEPMYSAYATSRSPSKTPTVPAERSYDGRCQSPTMSASSRPTEPRSCCSWAAITSNTARESGIASGRLVRSPGRSRLMRASVAQPPGCCRPNDERTRSRSGSGCVWRSSGVADRGDVELELDLLGDEDAAGLERGVPGQAPVLAVDGRAALEADAQVAERV